MDVDVWVDDQLQVLASHLDKAGLSFDPHHRKFNLSGVPVHLITIDQTGFAPGPAIEMEQIQTVSLADLISLKLSSGTKSVLRAQDIADVIGLIRANKLTEAFTPKVAKPFRKDFRNLLQAVAKGI